MSIEKRIGKRRIRIDLSEYNSSTKIIVTVAYPKHFKSSWSDETLTKEADNHVKSIKGKIILDIKNILKNRLSKINVNDKIISPIVSDFFKNISANYTDSNYSSELNKKFDSLEKTIDNTLKKINGKELMSKWCEENPYLSTFPNARSMEREFIFHMGPTNSGKTYTAIQDLKESSSGCYLAPLRLLAHEIYDELNKDGIYTSLITGEEKVIIPGSTVLSSTIEMANYSKRYDVCIIDEVQMLTDSQRGWAWTQAICGIPAEKIYLAGSEEALPYVKKLVEEILQEKLTIKKFERKTKLKIEDEIYTDESEPQEGDAFIVFSRKRIFEVKNQIDNSSVIYGSLSPEVRKSEASKFKNKDTQSVISTDAIGMGLNLPIKRVVFLDDEKFDGRTKKRPDPQLIKQIAGRAGRYGIYEEGSVTATNHDFLNYIKKCLSKDRIFDATDYKFFVAPNMNLIMEVSKDTQTTNLDDVLLELKEIFYYDSLFSLMDIQTMVDVSRIINHNLPLEIKYVYSCSPINLKLERDKFIIRNWSNNHHNNKQNLLKDIPKVKDKMTSDTLWYYENHIKMLTCYLWLSYRYPEIYPDYELVREEIKLFDNKIIDILDNIR